MYRLFGSVMKNCFNNLQKIEFVLTYACTGNCKHCSQGEHTKNGVCLDSKIAIKSVKSLAQNYNLQTALVFGGEPLLFPDAACKIIACARDCKIPKRQVITNGYFTKDTDKMRDVARKLFECGVNDLLLSVDAFHQQTIPLEVVVLFATELKRAGVPTRIQPAWLVDRCDCNPYNEKTRKIVDSLCALGFSESDGNVIFCEGNAKKYLSDYFNKDLPQNPYIEDPSDIRCISVDPEGNTLCGNIYKTDILQIMKNYKGENNDK